MSPNMSAVYQMSCAGEYVTEDKSLDAIILMLFYVVQKKEKKQVGRTRSTERLMLPHPSQFVP